MSDWTTKDIPNQKGKLAIVTGALTGIGYDTAMQLAIAGADVILAARKRDLGASCVEKLNALAPNSKIRFEYLDLSDLSSVKDFAARLNQEGTPIGHSCKQCRRNGTTAKVHHQRWF